MKNQKASKFLFEEKTWNVIREEVKPVNSELTEIIDEINPDKTHTFFKIIAPYGSEFLKNTKLWLPDSTGSRLIPLEEQNSHIKESLSYNEGSNPVSITLKNSLELFLELEDRVIPYSLVTPGKILGTWKIMEDSPSHCPATFIWGLTAGARSVFMLPKIAETACYKKLKAKFGVSIDKPRNLRENWQTFNTIINNAETTDTWNTELLFFNNKWFEHKQDKAWARFNYYLVNEALKNSSYWRNQYIWELIFSTIQKNQHIKTSLYNAQIAKHLLAISTGAVLGFQPAIDDSLAPINLLQEIFIADYGLKNYLPIIMQPAIFDLYDNKSPPVYYSLQYPTSFEFALKSNEQATTLTGLHEVKVLLKKYLDEIKGNKLNVVNTPLYKAAQEVTFDFFHSNTSIHKDIKKSECLPLEDNFFMQSAKKHKNRKFPHSSNFVNGCVRIAHKK
jgi:hypothetical protein